jgi:hypothetical protein
MTRKRARMTVTAEEVKAGKSCACTACLRDGAHEPDCPVHDEPAGDCNCDREDQTSGAG